MENIKELFIGISDIGWELALGAIKTSNTQISGGHLDLMKMCFELGHEAGSRASVDMMRDLYENDMDTLEVMLDPPHE